MGLRKGFDKECQFAGSNVFSGEGRKYGLHMYMECGSLYRKKMKKGLLSNHIMISPLGY